jgi:hypothetical protein
MRRDSGQGFGVGTKTGSEFLLTTKHMFGIDKTGS